MKSILAKVASILVAASLSVAISGCDIFGDIFGINHEHVCTTDAYGYDQSYHWNYCDSCGEHINVGRHTASSVWTSDEDAHWQECTVCGYQMNFAAHNFNSENVCTICGYILPVSDDEQGGSHDPDDGETDDTGDSGDTDNTDDTGDTGGDDDDDFTVSGEYEEITSADLSIHFLELGNKYTGDCTLIKVGDTEVLIDAGSRQNSAAAIKEYVDQYCTDGVLEYVIATHAHQDHIAGFVGNSSGSGRTGILYQYQVGTLIQFALTDATSQIYNNYCTAVEYAQSNGTAVYTADQCIAEEDGAQTVYNLNDDGSIYLTVLDNYYYYNSAKSTDGGENNYSVCVLLTQELESGEEYNYLFTGDLESEGEEYLVQLNDLPEVELFKGGHHGSYTASSDALLSVIKPQNVAVCCCVGTSEYTSNADHQFPAQEFITRVSRYTENVYCTTLITDYSAGEYTSMNGDIVFYCSNAEGALRLWCSNNTTKLKDTEWFAANRTWG